MGWSWERGSPGNQAVRGARGVRSAPPPKCCAGAPGARGRLRERGARRAGLGGHTALLAPAQPPGSASASGPLCWRSFQAGCFCVGFSFFLSLPSQSYRGGREVPKDYALFLLKPSIAMSRCHSEPSNPGAIGGCDGHRNVEMCPATLQKTVECSAQGCHGASLLSPCESPRTCLDDAPWAGHLI